MGTSDSGMEIFILDFLMRFQRYIRGSGLAYGAYISNDTEAGLLTFSLYRVSL